MVYDDETLQVKRNQQKLKNKNVNMQGFEERLSVSVSVQQSTVFAKG